MLLIANLLASIGGGRVISAGKGVANLRLLGSGSILAFLTGSALGLALLLTLRRISLHSALTLVSVASLGNALFGLIVVSGAATEPGRPLRLEGLSAWLFLGSLVLLCALWYAGRSLRSTLAAEGSQSWLALCEAAYFAGFICGLLLGPVSLAGQAGVVGALLLDLLLLGGVVACDALLGVTLSLREQSAATSVSQPQSSPGSHSPANPSAVRPMLAFACLGVACQVVVFHLADLLSRTDDPRLVARADSLLAVFYMGIAVAAISAYWLKPGLQKRELRPVFCLQLRRHRLRLPLMWVLVLIGGLVCLVVLGVGAGSPARAAPHTLSDILLLTALGLSTAIYELLVLAVVGWVGSLDSRAVGISIGVAATAAALALFALGLGGIGRGGLLITTTLGLALSFGLVSGSFVPGEDL